MTTLEDNQFDHIFRNLQMSREEYIRDVTDKSLAILKRRYFPPIPPEEDNHLWIGINPPPDTISLESLHKKLITILSKYKWIEPDKYLATLEAHTDNGFRPHIHLMIISHEKPNRVISALANSNGIRWWVNTNP